MLEVIRPIPGFPDYSITEDGRVWSIPRKGKRRNKCGDKWLKPRKHKGYMWVSITKQGKCYRRSVHQLLLETYVGPKPPDQECRHLDGNKANNRLDNLKWGTRKENVLDSVKHGTHKGFKRKEERLEYTG